MSTKDTSHSSYEELVTTGKLHSQKETVYQILKELGPSTQREVEAHYERSRGHYLMLRCRFSELEKEGRVKPTQKRPCKVTGKLAYTWGTDPKTPSLERRESKAETIKQFKHLLEQIAKAKDIEEVRRILGLTATNYNPPLLRLPINLTKE
jgi:hypothetical protein